MLFVIEPTGNHSNRLFQNAHFEAFCLEEGQKYCNPTLNSILKYYNSTPFKFNRYFLLAIKLMIKLRVIKVIDFNNPERSQFRGELMTSLVRKRPFVFVKGWYFSNEILLKKYRSYFKEKYRLKDRYIQNIELFKKYSEYDVVLGLHLRRGDYKSHEGGKYYYEDCVYSKFAKTFINEMNGKNVLCVIFSNVEVDRQYYYDELNKVDLLFSNEPWYSDHYLMSQCDFLIGPPSTFTMWASFMGKAKYFHIMSKSSELEMEKFIGYS